MSMRDELAEDARADVWERRRTKEFCSTCHQTGSHHSACPDNDEPEVEEDDEDEPEATTAPQVIAERGEIPDPYLPGNGPGLWGSPWVNTSTKGTTNE